MKDCLQFLLKYCAHRTNRIDSICFVRKPFGLERQLSALALLTTEVISIQTCSYWLTLITSRAAKDLFVYISGTKGRLRSLCVIAFLQYLRHCCKSPELQSKRIENKKVPVIKMIDFICHSQLDM